MSDMEPITFHTSSENGDQPLTGFVCGKPSSPGIVVIQEWWGVTDIIKGHAMTLAEQGYRCLVPDLYHGKSTLDKEEATHLMSNLDWQKAVQELKAAVEYLRKSEGSEKVGCIGFCMGGALALAAAQHAGVDVAVSFYGTPPKELCQPENIPKDVPVELHVGELDSHVGFSDVPTVEAWGGAVNEHGGKAECFVYEECGHGFLNSGSLAVSLRNQMGHPEPSEVVQTRAWGRVFECFKKHLM
jgi:carboxymethylenebutenolidase